MVEIKIDPTEVLALGEHWKLGSARTQFTMWMNGESEVTGVFIADPKCESCGSFVYDEKFYPIFLAHEDMHVALVETGEPAASLSYDTVDRGLSSLHVCGLGTRITELRGPTD